MVVMVPTSVLPPLMPSTDQVTAVFDVPVTEAVNCCGLPKGIEMVAGLIVRLMPPGPRGEPAPPPQSADRIRSEEHTSELQSLAYLVCRLLLEKKKKKNRKSTKHRNIARQLNQPRSERNEP